MPAAAPVALIESRIYLIRGQKVLLDADLASLYQVETKILNQAVRRNRERFPADFMFQLTRKEDEALRSQIVTSNESTGEAGAAIVRILLRSKGLPCFLQCSLANAQSR